MTSKMEYDESDDVYIRNKKNWIDGSFEEKEQKKNGMWQYLVNIAASFLSDVLSNPRVKAILVQIMVSSMNAAMEQEDLGERIMKTQQMMAKDSEVMTRNLGEQLPNLAATFLSGAYSGMREKGGTGKQGK